MDYYYEAEDDELGPDYGMNYHHELVRRSATLSNLPQSGKALKGTGTRDLIWLKVVSLDRSWLVGAYG